MSPFSKIVFVCNGTLCWYVGIDFHVVARQRVRGFVGTCHRVLNVWKITLTKACTCLLLIVNYQTSKHFIKSSHPSPRHQFGLFLGQ